MELNPEMLLESAINAPLETKLIPCPEGEYTMLISALAIRTGTDKNGDGYTLLNVTLEVEDQSVRESTGREKVFVQHSCKLDIVANPANGQPMLDTGKGKNIDLGRLREACDLNEEGQDFTMNMLLNRIVKGKVTQRTVEETGDVYAEVKRGKIIHV